MAFLDSECLRREEAGLKDLEQSLGYRFNRSEPLNEALRHRSWVKESGRGPSNERLEFLGDTILQFVVTDFIYQRYPEYSEGELAKLRSSTVRKEVLHDVGRELEIGAYLMLGKGEEASGGRSKASIVADAMEAVLGAVYLDGGLERSRSLILGLWKPIILARAAAPGWGDFKSRLQEHLAQDGERPAYHISEEGPDHDKSFTATVEIRARVWGTGTGSSKREAEQAAAGEALRALTPILDAGV